MKSIMQSEKVCYICGTTNLLEEHHLFGAANRENSERYGLKVFLCYKHHRDHKEGAHHSPLLMDYLHRKGQVTFEEKHGGREDFMRIFGRNYL